MAHNDLQPEIERLDKAIESNGRDWRLYMERGKLLHKSGKMGAALNDFFKVADNDPGLRAEAETLIVIIEDILEFRNTDIYNP